MPFQENNNRPIPAPKNPSEISHGPSHQASHLLAKIGIELSEPLTCGLGGGIGFLYAIFEYAQLPHPLLTIVAQHHPQPWLEGVALHLGLELATVTSSTERSALAKLDAMVDTGSAAQLTVARGLLPWHSSHPEEAADPYPIVVAERSSSDYLVVDNSARPLRITGEALSVAWAAHRKGRFAITTLVSPHGDLDLSGAIRAAIRTTHSHLTGPVLGIAYDINFGLSGLERFAADLADQKTRKGWSQRFSNPAAFRETSRRLAECLSWAHTAPGATRPLYACFLLEAQSITGLELAVASEIAAEAGRRWTALAEFAASVTHDNDPRECIARYAEQVAAIVPLEASLAHELGKALAELYPLGCSA